MEGGASKLIASALFITSAGTSIVLGNKAIRALLSIIILVGFTNSFSSTTLFARHLEDIILSGMSPLHLYRPCSAAADHDLRCDS